LYNGDVENFLNRLTNNIKFDLIVSSPPYNLNKVYENKMDFEDYLHWQDKIIKKTVKSLSENGSLCWQVGTYISKKGKRKSHLIPLDIVYFDIFQKLGLKLRNRIIWAFRHGANSKYNFSGRYETILWFTRESDNYTFNLDDVRVDQLYPGKKSYKGESKGQYSSNPLGKNPGNVWDNIPNVKSHHVEKTIHPCQYPVGLIERLVLALTNKNNTVFDPFMGVGSAGVAAAIHNRKFAGCEIRKEYVDIAENRINSVFNNTIKYRPHNKPIADHKKSNLSKFPKELLNERKTLKKEY